MIRLRYLKLSFLRHIYLSIFIFIIDKTGFFINNKT